MKTPMRVLIDRNIDPKKDLEGLVYVFRKKNTNMKIVLPVIKKEVTWYGVQKVR